VPLDRPYFMPDPLLDPPQFPPPGWFGGLELDVLKPHLINHLVGTVQNAAQAAGGTSTTVALPAAALDWAPGPRAFVGYRLPAGFGEILLGYRGLASRGTEDAPGPDGPATLHSRLDFNLIDLDYTSREYSLWPNWEMRWLVGIEVLTLFFDSHLEQSPAQASAGSGLLDARESNRFVGVGPHVGLELARHVADTGLTFTFRTEFTTDLGRVHQGFFTRSTTTSPDGQPLTGETHVAAWMDAPILRTQAGVNWRPLPQPRASFFLGYQYEYWWRVGGDIDTGSRADLFDQGVVLEAALRF
jgi:hypothetical protein